MLSKVKVEVEHDIELYLEDDLIYSELPSALHEVMTEHLFIFAGVCKVCKHSFAALQIRNYP